MATVFINDNSTVTTIPAKCNMIQEDNAHSVTPETSPLPDLVKNAAKTSISADSIVSNQISIETLPDEDYESSSITDSDCATDDFDTGRNDKYIVETINNCSSVTPQNGSVVVSQVLQRAVECEPRIGSIAVQNSSDVTFGNKTFYQGPITIKQFVVNGKEEGKPNEGFKSLICNHKLRSILLIFGSVAGLALLGVLIVYLSTKSEEPNWIPDLPYDNFTPSGYELVRRKDWGAQRPNAATDNLTLPVNRSIIYHTVSKPCDKKLLCIEYVQNIQNDHMLPLGDIAYNFLVAGDGRVYEGRGWNAMGAHFRGQNRWSIGIAFIGSFNTVKPPKKQYDVLLKLLEEGVRQEKLTKNFIIYPNLCFQPTISPGKCIVDELKLLPNYYENIEGADSVCGY